MRCGQLQHLSHEDASGLLWCIAEAKCSEAHACLVLLGPARWALLSRGVHWLLPLFAEAQLSEALACVVSCLIEGLARPACIRRAFASWLGASRTQGVTCTFFRKLGGRLAETNCSKAVASLVLLGPARWALLARCVDRFFCLPRRSPTGQSTRKCGRESR